MPKVYIASKFKHGSRWKELADASYYSDHPWNGIIFTSRWFLHYSNTIPDEPQFCKLGWEHDIEDIIASDVVILYAEPDEKLRGALVEVGAALAWSRDVLLVGEIRLRNMAISCKRAQNEGLRLGFTLAPRPRLSKDRIMTENQTKSILALDGPATCGKSTLADLLIEQHGYIRLSFAAPIKEMLRTLLRCQGRRPSP